jgi:hypothetical protein
MLPSWRATVAAPVLVLALLAAGSSVALGSPQEVLGDYQDNGRIEGTYSLTELRGALELRAEDPLYGVYRDVVEQEIQEVLVGGRDGNGSSSRQAPAGEQRAAERVANQNELPADDVPPLVSPEPGEPGGGVPVAFLVLSALAGLLLVIGAGSAAYRRLRR